MNRTEYNRANYLKNRDVRLAAQKEYYAANKESRREYNKEYAVKNKDSIRVQRKKYRECNTESRKQAMRDWYLKNAEYAKSKAKEYRELHKEKMLEWSKQYRKTRMSTDPVYKAAIRIRSLVNVKLYSKGYTKKSRTYEILGCSFTEFTAHIESQFQENMSWDNHGEWHLDHIIPIASAATEQDVIRLNHYSNFQPLWALENLKKGSK